MLRLGVSAPPRRIRRSATKLLMQSVLVARSAESSSDAENHSYRWMPALSVASPVVGSTQLIYNGGITGLWAVILSRKLHGMPIKGASWLARGYR